MYRRVYVRDLWTHTTILASRASGAAGADEDAASEAPAISADARVVAFSSRAANLDPADTDTVADVYARDLDKATTTLVSRATGVAGRKGDDASARPRLSADGRALAFGSRAANLDPADQDREPDVFVRDLQRDTTTLVSRATGATGAKGDAYSAGADISADGRRVAFETSATNLSAEDEPSADDIFVRDLSAATTTLVSRAAGAGGAAADRSSRHPALSSDGRTVAFTSAATNLSAADPDAHSDVYVRELAAAQSVPTLPAQTHGAR